MSDPRIESISQSLGGTPPEIVERSAAARAAAQGISLDDVLASWSGGAALAPASAPEPTEPAVEAEPAPEPAAPEVPEPAAPAPVPAGAVAVVEAPVVEVEAEEIVDPAPLRDRMRVGARIGALSGVLLGILAVVATLPLMLSRLSLPSGEGTPAIEITPLAALLTIAALSAVFGAVITVTCRGMARYLSPAYATGATVRGSAVLGAFNGAVLGFIGGGVVVAMAEATLAETKLLPVRSLVFTVLVGGVVLGAVAGALAQAMGQPAMLHGEAAEEAEVVKRRLQDSMMIPLVATAVIAVIVVSLGMLFVRFPSFAPLLAILVALGILGFASLMASRPNLRVTRGEVLLAAAGVGVVLLMIALVAAQVGGAGHGEEEHSLSIVRGHS